MKLDQKVPPLGVLGIIVFVALVMFFGWGFVVGRPNVDTPPYTQTKLAKLIVHSFRTSDDMQFYFTTFDIREVEEFVNASFDFIKPRRHSADWEAQEKLRDKWYEKSAEAQNSYEKILARFDEDELSSLTYDGFEIMDCDIDSNTDRTIGKRFVISMHSDFASYTLDSEYIIETDDGWKCAGKMKLTEYDTE
ncbi:MAG: hypothetical protein K8R90_02320 [Candidatus Cloacimonetes bacterium]|nr:hypothetical protein [Candidatus Cloacimonadota bacterium]